MPARLAIALELCVRCGPDGQGEVKSCTARRIIDSPQEATVRFNYGAADLQSHPRSLSLGCKERIKNLVCLLRREPHTGIADRDKHLTIPIPLRLDGELARAVRILHRIDIIHHEV